MTFGTLAYTLEGKRGQWAIQAQPHVMTRLKRMFPRVAGHRTGTVTIVDTPEVARDLEWLMSRFPLAMDESATARLRLQVERHHKTERAVEDILGGVYHRPARREPARPGREYQLQAAELVLATGRLLLADPVGLGKTMSAYLVLLEPETLPALVVTLTHLPTQWLRELEKTLPWLQAHILKKARPYPLADPLFGQPDVIITSYSKLAGWGDTLAGQVNTIIFDEVQELRHGDTDRYTAAAQIADQCRYKVGLSATPVMNFGGEIHTIMQVLAPDALGTRDEFIREWDAHPVGLKGNLSIADPKGLGTYLRSQGLVLRRTRQEVGRELPEPMLITVEVDTDHEVIQQATIDVVQLAQSFLTSTDRFQRMRDAGDLDWKLRQATGIAKAPFVAAFVRMLLESEDKVVLAGWHRAVYDIWLRDLAEFLPVLYTGSESPQQKLASQNAFVHGDSRLMIMSIRAGAGLDGLQEVCSVGVVGELDWTPGIHHQFGGRFSREGQPRAVSIYFPVSTGGTDPLMAEVLNLKRQQSEALVDPDRDPLELAQVDPGRMRRLALNVLQSRGIPIPKEGVPA